jgi:methylated-DNA-[protein]-cysteine S-methyltransferase
MSGINHLLERMGYRELIQEDKKVQPILAQIGEYLAGDRITFDFPIHWSIMTPFQQQALQATFAIPYGQTVTYGEIAQRIGRPHSARAVGRAQATNPMPLVIPCHRVLGADGGLHGYGAGEGFATKAWLLKLEAETIAK